jgi:hypothetical protein
VAQLPRTLRRAPGLSGSHTSFGQIARTKLLAYQASAGERSHARSIGGEPNALKDVDAQCRRGGICIAARPTRQARSNWGQYMARGNTLRPFRPVVRRSICLARADGATLQGRRRAAILTPVECAPPAAVSRFPPVMPPAVAALPQLLRRRLRLTASGNGHVDRRLVERRVAQSRRWPLPRQIPDMPPQPRHRAQAELERQIAAAEANREKWVTAITILPGHCARARRPRPDGYWDLIRTPAKITHYLPSAFPSKSVP